MTGHRVLVVEDDDLAALTMVRVLRRSGYDVERCGSLAAAAISLEQSLPDVVLLDRRLGDGDGLAFGRDLRERLGRRAPRVVLLSGDAVPEAEQAEVDAFVHKPADLRSLLAAVSGAED